MAREPEDIQHAHESKIAPSTAPESHSLLPETYPISPTKITIENNSVEQTITDTHTPYLTTKPKNPLSVVDTDRLESTSDPRSGFDTGVIAYSKCYLFWKKERDKKENKYIFTSDIHSKDINITCTRKELISDPHSGEYRVEFSIHKKYHS